MKSNDKGKRRRDVRTWLPWAVATLSLVAGGVCYRAVSAKVLGMASGQILLPVPLSEFPKEIHGWRGEDSPLTAEIERVAGNDDYLNRLYANENTGEMANLYVAYSGRPRTMVGHQPRVCYVNAGWVYDETTREEITAADGGKLEAAVHRFHQPSPRVGDVVVVNYYVLNGVATTDESSFTGYGWRLPNIAGNPAWYVAQVQISSVSEAAAKNLAAATAGRLLDFLPDANGKVREAEARRATAAVETSK